MTGSLGVFATIGFCVLAGPLSAQRTGQSDPLHDWGRVAALQPGLTLIVKPYRGSGAKTKGVLARAGERSIVIRTSGGERRISKAHVRRVCLRRRGWGKAPWIGAGAGFAVFALAATAVDDFSQPKAAFAAGAVGAGLGALGGQAARALGRKTLVYVAPKKD